MIDEKLKNRADEVVSGFVEGLIEELAKKWPRWKNFKRVETKDRIIWERQEL